MSPVHRVRPTVAGILAVLSVGGAVFGGEPPHGSDWPQFRGAYASGIGDGVALPARWDVAGGENIAWKTPIPGLAHSSPIVVGDKVFVTTAVPAGGEAELKVGLYGAGDSADDMVEHAWKLYCLDAASGRIVWERTCVQGVPRFKRHTKATHCNPTPASDGTYVVAHFGTEGLFCYTVEGELKWKKDLGPLDVGPHNGPGLEWGFASSPILVDGRVVVQCDVKQEPFLAAFDAADGRQLWRVARGDVPGWCTPTALRTPDGWQVITNGCREIGGYDLADGKRLWSLAGGGGIPVPAPVVADGLIYLTSNHQPLRDGDPRKPIFVVRASARGELAIPEKDESNEHIAWMKSNRGNYMQTPLVYQGVAYFCYDNGILTAYDARSGEQLFRERLGGGQTGFTASAVAGDGKVYLTSEQGEIHVLKAGRTFDPIGVNEMEEICMATPAISHGRILIRTQKQVVCIEDRTR